MHLKKPRRSEFYLYKKLEFEFYLYHKPYNTLLQDVDPRKRNLRKEFLNLIKERNAFFRFVEVDGEVAGYIYGVIKNTDENERGYNKIGDLNSIVVLKKFRSKGLAEYMTKEFFSWLKSKNIKYVKSSCNVKNEASIRFHRKLGFLEQHITFGRIL